MLLQRVFQLDAVLHVVVGEDEPVKVFADLELAANIYATL